MKNKPKAYKALRAYTGLRSKELQDLMKPTGLSISALSKRLCGRLEWKRADMYAILRFLDLPDDYLPILFPEDIYEDFVYDARSA